jgi:hypothetical protein
MVPFAPVIAIFIPGASPQALLRPGTARLPAGGDVS